METKQNQQKKQKSDKEINDWRTKINWEKIYKYASYGILAIQPFFLKDLYEFRQVAEKNQFSVLTLQYGLLSLSFCVLYTIVREIYFKLTHNFVESKILPQYQGKTREQHTKKVQKWVFDAVYYTGTSVYGYMCFKNTSWYPLSFDENVEDRSRGLFQDFPSLPDQKDYYNHFYNFLVIQFGHHIWGLLHLVLVRRKEENKFWEWFLHHILAFTLIFYSSFVNMVVINVAVLLIHDIGDIFIVMFKTYGEFSDKGFTFKYLVFQMIAGWFVSRIYLYPKTVILPILYNYIDHFPSYDQKIASLILPLYTYQTIMLCMLYILHIYWFACMITLLISYVKKTITQKKKVEAQAGYGNEWDYYQYCDADKKNKKEEQEQAKLNKKSQ